MHSPVFFVHTQISNMQKHSAVKVDFLEVNQSSSRSRSNSLPALTQRFMSALSSSTHRHSGNSSPSPRMRSHSQTKSHIRSLSNSLRSLLPSRKPRRSTVACSDDSEEESLGDILDLFPSCPSTLPQQKGHDSWLRSNDVMLLPAAAFDHEGDTSEPEGEPMLLIQESVLGRMDLL